MTKEKILNFIGLFLMLFLMLKTFDYLKENYFVFIFLYLAMSFVSVIFLYKLINIKTITSKAFIILLLTLSLIIRYYWITTTNTQPVSDFSVFYKTAIDISKGNFNTIYNSTYYYYATYNVSYTLVLSIIFYFFKSLFALKVFNVIISLGIVYFFYKTALIISSEKSARIASLLIAIYPPFIIYTSVLTNQTISILFLLIALYKFFNKSSLLAVGLFLGLAQLMRPTAIIYLLGLILYIILNIRIKSNLKTTVFNIIKITSVFYFVLFIFSSIYLLVNFSKHSLFYNPIPNYKILVGLNHKTTGLYSKTDNSLIIKSTYKEEANTLIKERVKDKSKLFKLIKNKINLFWGREDRSLQWALTKNVKNHERYKFIYKHERYFNMTILIFGFLYFLFSVKNTTILEEKTFFIFPLFGFLLIYMIIEIQTRYRYEIYPIFFFIAGSGIEKTVEILKNKLFKPIVKKTN